MNASQYMARKPVVVTHVPADGSSMWGISQPLRDGDVYLTFGGKGCGKFPSRRVAEEITQMLEFGEKWILQCLAIERAKACVLRILLGVAGIALGLAFWLGGGK